MPEEAITQAVMGGEEDLIFLGGLGAGRKSNPGGLLALTVIGKLHYEHDRKVMRGGGGGGRL